MEDAMARATGADCPSTMELEAFLTAQGGDARVGQHVETCPRCQAALEEIRANNALMARIVSLNFGPEDVQRWKNRAAEILRSGGVLESKASHVAG